MKIDGVHRTGSGGPVKKKKPGGSADGSFSVLLETDESPGVAGMSGTQALAPMSSLLALQEADDTLEKRRERVNYGETLLNYLESLQLGLLNGSVEPGLVRQMTTEVRAMHTISDDPVLETILEQIEVRAEVELAKLQQAASRPRRKT
ncbi:MAG: hypothetical protein H6908_01425 [Hyphomicrobiales bacterium]|nr:hypothetical protein [Hyphomicrobiales bacterium]